MKWIHATPESTSNAIAERLLELLREGQVTWFVSGGSNVKLEVASLIWLVEQHAPLKNLTILLSDERFGKVGHADSNWQLLQDAGFMIDGPTYIEPFTEEETSLELAVVRYDRILRDLLQTKSYWIAQLGMGVDGHTSGILPNSVGTSDTELVVGYVSEPFERLTTTFRALSKLHEVNLVTFGADKWPQLGLLRSHIDPSIQPTQIIKDIPRTTIYTDYQTEQAE